MISGGAPMANDFSDFFVWEERRLMVLKMSYFANLEAANNAEYQ